jgi:hypothetical protein
MKTPLYVTIEDYVSLQRNGITINLPQNSFVRPIKYSYVPEHVKERDGYDWFNPEEYVYVYCHYGILPLRWEILRKDE